MNSTSFIPLTQTKNIDIPDEITQPKSSIIEKQPVNISRFVVEEGIIGVTFGTFIAFGITNFLKSLNINVLSPFLKKYLKTNTNYGQFLASFIEFLIILIIVSTSYKYLVYPMFHTEIVQDKKTKQREKEWRGHLLDEVHKLQNKMVFLT